MLRKYGLWVLTASLLLALAGCGGGSDNNVDATIRVQLTRESAPNDAYHAPGMTVTLKKVDGILMTQETDTNGVATFPIAGLGTYEVIQVSGMDVTGGDVDDTGLEFVKEPFTTTPTPTTAPRIIFTPETVPSRTISANGTAPTLNVPVPNIRQTTIVAKGTLSGPADGATPLPSLGIPAFAGRILLSSLNFPNANHNYIRVNGSTNFFTLTPNAGQITLSIFPGAVYVDDIAHSTDSSSNSVVFEAPSGSDCAVQSADIITCATIGNFGLISATPLSLHYDGVLPVPSGNISLDYEIQKFDLISPPDA